MKKTCAVFLIICSLIRPLAGQITGLEWNSTGSTRSDGPYTIGNLFTVSAVSNLEVTSLGVMDMGLDGFTGVVGVGLWDSTGTTLLASITSGFNAGNTTVGNYRFQTLGSPVILNANTTYLIGAVVGTGLENFADNSGVAAFSTTSAAATYLTLGASQFASGGSLLAPTSAGGVPVGRWGPANLQFNAIPEPSTYAAIFGGLVLVGAMIRRRRQAA